MIRPLQSISELRQQGDYLKQKGMSLAAENRAAAVAAGQVAFLKALLESESGICSLDDATDDLAVAFPDGGKWRGQVALGLARRGLIRSKDVVRSIRPSRHRSWITRWELVDRGGAQAALAELQQLVEESTKNPQAAATAAGDVLNDTTANLGKESSRETV
jgi:hypothetical protein